MVTMVTGIKERGECKRSGKRKINRRIWDPRGQNLLGVDNSDATIMMKKYIKEKKTKDKKKKKKNSQSNILSITTLLRYFWQ